MWLAPLPVLYAASRENPPGAFFIAFGAWAAGGLNLWQYLYGLLGVPLRVAVLADLGPALVFAIAVLLWRWFIRRGALAQGSLGFAVLWVCYEFAVQKLSVHSTFGNLAYSQMDCLPVVQMASVAGVAGISFLLFFFPAAVAAILFGRGLNLRFAWITLALAVVVLGWGGFRLLERPDATWLKVGLIASDVQANLRPSDASQIQKTFQSYAAEAETLIHRGARVIVMPEKNAVLAGDTTGLVDHILGGAATNGIAIATGVERWTDHAKLNELRVYERGSLTATYEKHHMLPPFESNLLPGNSLTTLREGSSMWGMEICKDMDFPALSREYGNAGVGLLLVPAWDFDADGWYHGRMAILRGVESGFSIARAPKQGVLTISDDRGRVLAERETNSAAFATLLAAVPVRHDDTLYERWGDWFGWLNVVALAALVLRYVYAKDGAY